MAASTADILTEAVRARARRSRPRRVATSLWHFARYKPLGFVGAIMVGFLLTVAIFAPIVAPYDPGRIDLRHALEGPSAAYKLGTDDVGHDVLSRLIWGARVSMIIGFGAVVSSSLVATVLALVSAYFGGWVDMLIMRVIDAWIAMPDLIILITILGIVRRTDANMMYALLFALAFSRIAGVTRLYRSYVLEQRSRPFIEAAEGIGASPLRIMFRHILPNALVPSIVFSMSDVVLVILAGSSISYLGLGVQPPTAEWGVMIAEGQNFMTTAWWITAFPGCAIVFLALGFSLLADGLGGKLGMRE